MTTCPYVCNNKTEFGYCKSTACTNPKYNNSTTITLSTVGIAEYRINKPFVADDGIYMPVEYYSVSDSVPAYRLVMTKEMFQEAYRKYIVERTDNENLR